MLDIDKNKDIIIQRVMQYGVFSDWIIIYKFYGLKTITDVTKKLRDLNDKSVYFISNLSNVPIDSFLSYTTKQSIKKHSDLYNNNTSETIEKTYKCSTTKP